MEPVEVEVMRSWKVAHLGSQRRLTAYSRRHAAEKCGHLRTSLGEAEDIVHEQKHILA